MKKPTIPSFNLYRKRMRKMMKIAMTVALFIDTVILVLAINKPTHAAIRAFCARNKFLALLLGIGLVIVIHGPYVYLYMRMNIKMNEN